MKILLTGASGLLGSHLLAKGLIRGDSFRLLIRGVPKRSYLHEILPHPQIEIIPVDFNQIMINPENFKSLFADVDVFINAMGFASPLKDDISQINHVNYLYPQVLFSIAQEAGVSFAVHVSSVATMSSGQNDEKINEASQGQFRFTPYAEMKFKMDQWLDQFTTLPLLTVHPCYMLGKWDSRPSSGAILFALKLGKMSFFIDNKKNFVSPADVASTILKGIENRVIGHFLLGGVNLPIKKFIELCCIKLELPFDNISFCSPHDWGKICEDFDLQSRMKIEEFCLSNSIDDSKARKQLGHAPCEDIDKILKETISYFVEKKFLRLKGTV